jgi:hypothetical protein
MLKHVGFIEIRLFTPEVEVLLRMIAEFLRRSLQ